VGAEATGEGKEATSTLECGQSELSSNEAALEAEQKRMGELCPYLLARELTADLLANHLAFMEKEMADKEKRFTMKQLQELATMCKRLEEL
jgi:hypothetical protein